MGIGRGRSREVAFMVAHGLDDREVVRLSIGLYALFRVVSTIRFAHNVPGSLHPLQMFRLYAKKALNKNTREILQSPLTTIL